MEFKELSINDLQEINGGGDDGEGKALAVIGIIVGTAQGLYDAARGAMDGAVSGATRAYNEHHGN
jgi:bacteriocin-like protein